MEIEQLVGSLWSLKNELVQACAIRDGGGFKLVDASTAGEADALLTRLGEIARGAIDEVRLTEIVLTYAHADHSGSAAVLVQRTGARVVTGEIDAPVSRDEQPPPAPYRLSDADRAVHDDLMARVPSPPPVTPGRLVESGDSLDWELRPTLTRVFTGMARR